MAVAGYATEEGTARYAERHADTVGRGHFRRAKRLTSSSIGIGTYLGAADDQTDRLVANAIFECVKGGINVIDSAANYRRERGEKSIGVALGGLFFEEIVTRDELVICTKGGFIPQGPQAFEDQFMGKGDISADDLVGQHCMHPEYLEAQLDQSLNNLGLETIDVYYLHNPESQAGKVDEETFWARIEAAFRMLEGAVAAGKIRTYGLATWNAFRVSEGQTAHMSLRRAKTIAQEVAGDGPDHLRYIQLPLNLAMTEALIKPTQVAGGQELAAIRAARSMGFGVFTSGSIGQGKLKDLPDGIANALGEDLQSNHQRALQFARSAPGVGTALIGLKGPGHVSEALELCRQAPLAASVIVELFK